ncbi:type II secretion system F family protein [Sanguibacter suaedae]|uniref:Type II secretion system F family protein n=1 Tax=Sanguibacter suaedae TaxID=2795737 RepID=A0A934IE83_9MICO|nr:type II secretion system F family protein [Sanguibacter suaedae]MBI9115329.1 type II secretion system F family protein [Sanguibacter suaedae]
MTAVIVAGAVAGTGILVLILTLVPPRTLPASTLAQLDLQRSQQRARATAEQLDPRARVGLRRDLGMRLVRPLNSLGVELGPVRSDLAILGRTLENHVATSVLVATAGFLAPLVLAAVLALLTGTLSIPLPAALSVAAAAAGLVVPTLVAHAHAEGRRRDFRHVVGSFLDLVAMSLAGGRGVPEALQSAAALSDGWAMVRIRNALQSARLHGQTPWSALGELGDELRIDELRDMASALALVAEDGAKVRESLSARANSMRRRELAEAEGKAGERSQSMLVAQLLLCVGFLVFLIYPAIVKVLGTD